MKILGLLLLIGGVGIMIWQVIKAAVDPLYKLERALPQKQFLYWMIGGVVAVIIGVVLARRGGE